MNIMHKNKVDQIMQGKEFFSAISQKLLFFVGKYIRMDYDSRAWKKNFFISINFVSSYSIIINYNFL